MIDLFVQNNTRKCTYKGDTYFILRNYKNCRIYYNSCNDNNGWHYVVTINGEFRFRWADNHLKAMIEVLEQTFELEGDA